MNYFTDFPLMMYLYNIGGKDQLRVVTDITLNVRMKKAIIANILLFEDYDIIDGDTPERIAAKIYRDPNLNWVIMLANDKFSNIADFPMSNAQLEKYVISKYGTGNRDQQHLLYGNLHYEDQKGKIVTGTLKVSNTIFGNPQVDAPWVDILFEPNPLAIPVTNFEAEFKINEAKRRIRLIHPNHIPKVVEDLRTMVTSGQF